MIALARHDSERGATLIIVAASLLMLFGATAMAVDLSALRMDIRADRLATDAAATAGAAYINPFAGSEADEACEAAWEYVLLNIGDIDTSAPPPNCGALASECTPSVSRTVERTAGPYRVAITHPVPDGHPLMGGQTLNEEVDGASCQRLGVEVERLRDFAFAPVLGFESGRTTVSSVARIAAGVGAGEVVPLLVLEPTSCNALYTSGKGAITVMSYEDSPGLIVVDSDANGGSGSNRCQSNRYAIDVKGEQNNWIRALPVPAPRNIPSAILSYALSGRPGTNPAYAYDPSDVMSGTGAIADDPPETWFRLYPEPIPVSRRITRAPIDWRYNCKTSYPLYLGTVPIDPCPHATATHIDNLVTSYTGNIAPPGFQRWTVDSGLGCNVGADIAVTGDWYIDCPGGFIVQNVDVSFTGGDVVLEGDIDVRAEGSFSVNQGGSADRIVYVRNNGTLEKRAQSSIHLERTFVYLEQGRVNLVGGSGGLVWTAPVEGNFEDLALWAEADTTFEIGGQAGNNLTGTFFTPLSNPFALNGQGGQFQTDAQFLTRRLEVKGQGEVRMRPDPDRQTLIPIREVRLIR